MQHACTTQLACTPRVTPHPSDKYMTQAATTQLIAYYSNPKGRFSVKLVREFYLNFPIRYGNTDQIESRRGTPEIILGHLPC